MLYQIFPRTFRAAQKTETNRRPYAKTPPIWADGHLDGITRSLDHICNLGVDGLYLNPIQPSDEWHGYTVNNLTSVDERLGGEEAFTTLMDEAKSNGLRIILDIPLPHSGLRTKQFMDITAKGGQSCYADWYLLDGKPINIADESRPAGYATWSDGYKNYRNHPMRNLANPAVVEHLTDAVRYWIDQGVDGFRFDCPHNGHYPLQTQQHFWYTIHDAAKNANPETYLVAEMWDFKVSDQYVPLGIFDGITNYPFMKAAHKWGIGSFVSESYLQRLHSCGEDFNAWQLAPVLLQMFKRYHGASHLNAIGSHDRARVHTLANGDQREHPDTIDLLVALQMSMPGSASVYYGDEIGMKGGDDPDNRRKMIWDQNRWNHEILHAHKRWIDIKRNDPSFSGTGFSIPYAQDNTLVIKRTNGDNTSYVGSNRGHTTQIITIQQDGHPLKLVLPPRSTTHHPVEQPADMVA